MVCSGFWRWDIDVGGSDVDVVIFLFDFVRMIGFDVDFFVRV